VTSRRTYQGRYAAASQIAQSFYAFGALLWVIRTDWSIALIVMVQLYYALAPRIAE
jgi:hypothetical protein